MNHSRTPARPDIGNALREAHRIHPDHAEAARRLARYLFSTDKLEELIQEFAPAPARIGVDRECLHYVGLAALVLGDTVLADRSLAGAVAAGHRASTGHWLKALHGLGRTDEATTLGMQFLEDYPEDDAAAQVIFGIMLAERRHGELWALCERLRAAGGWSARMVSALALAAHTPDQIAFIGSITDHALWVERKQLDSELRQSLSDQLQSLHSWGQLPRTKATVGHGRRIDKIHSLEHPPLAALFEHIRNAVADYIDTRADDLRAGASHSPIAALRPDCTTLRSWALAVREDGHEGWHIHPDGWLSGVVYVDMPDLTTTTSPHAGEIEFGPFPLGPAAVAAAWPAWRLLPRTGDVLLFPSYFAHRTWPTGLTQERICISFDILRRGIDNLQDIEDTPPASVSIGTEDQLIRHPRAVMAADAAGHQIFMNVDSGRYLATDETCVLVWDLLQAPMDQGELLGLLHKEFDTADADIESDLSRLLPVMVSCGLVDVV